MGQLQPWSQTPYDSNLSPQSNNFQRWLQTSINTLIGTLYPLSAPTVSTVGYASAVQVRWNEIPHAGYYVIYETNDQNAPTDDIPVGTVPANKGGPSNSFLRSGIADDNTRYYWVQPFSPTGVPGKIGGGIAGVATSFVPAGLSGSLIEIGIDSALQQIREDFLSGGITAGAVGAFGLTPITRGTATFSFQSGSYPFIGILRIATGGTSHNGGMIVPYSAQANPAISPFGPMNALPVGAHVKMQWIAQTERITNVSVILGFSEINDAITVGEYSTDPQNGIFFRYNTLSGFNDSTWKAESRKYVAFISAISRTSNVVSVTTGAAHDFQAGNLVTITGVSTDPSFNGIFTVATAPNNTHLTYAQTAANSTPTAAGATCRSTVFDTGVTPITPGYLRFEIESAAPGVFAFRISNGTGVSADKTIDGSLGHYLPTLPLAFMASIVTRTGSAANLDLDYLGIGFNSLIQPDPTKARWF